MIDLFGGNVEVRLGFFVQLVLRLDGHSLCLCVVQVDRVWFLEALLELIHILDHLTELLLRHDVLH